jgi:hypothetical protein
MVGAGHDDSGGRGGDEYVEGARVGGCGVKVRRLLVENWCPIYTSEAQLRVPLFISKGSASRSSTRRGQLGASRHFTHRPVVNYASRQSKYLCRVRRLRAKDAFYLAQGKPSDPLICGARCMACRIGSRSSHKTLNLSKSRPQV